MSQQFTKKRAGKSLSLIAGGVALLVLAFTLFTTKSYDSELRFAERSLSGKHGAVIPASCDSGISHFSGDCTTICSMATNPLVVSNTHYDAATNGCVCNNGKTNPPSCNLPPDPEIVIAANLASMPQTPSITSFTKDDNMAFLADNGNRYDIDRGGSTFLRWTVINAQSCNGSWGGTGLSTMGSYYTGSLITAKTYTLTCINGAKSASANITVTVGPYVPPDLGCFTAGTMVTMSDGSQRDIASVMPGEYIMSSYGPEQVMKKYAIPYTGTLYAFNGSENYFVTPTHPFMTTDGWKSFDPEGSKRESPGLEVTKLSVGDTLILANGKEKKLDSVKAKEASTMVYNFGINGSHRPKVW